MKTFRVENFRRLKSVRVDLEETESIFVGANNSGKTSATQIFRLFLNPSKHKFRVFDFSADCWNALNAIDPNSADAADDLPHIVLDLWFEVDDLNLHRVLGILPSLDWNGKPVGIRLSYQPRDPARLLANYVESQVINDDGGDKNAKSMWPTDLTDYLQRTLTQEYEIKYSVLDAAKCDSDGVPAGDYRPFRIESAKDGEGLVSSLIRVDFLDAQRHLSDSSGPGRHEDLSTRLSRFYERNLEKHELDLTTVNAIANSEQSLNTHFAEVFKPTLESLKRLGYPGLANPDLIVKATLDAQSILSSNARVHYALPTADGTPGEPSAMTLPDQYNGLGLKNLIYMVVEILDFHQRWIDDEAQRPPVHLIMIEEPEAHLHAQLQQVFVNQIFDLVKSDHQAFHSQLVITTHSSHVLYESGFKPIRYFSRKSKGASALRTEVKDLSTFYDTEEEPTRNFLQRYLKLTHCDLFFSDGVVLVEGNVERLLLPLIIEKDVKDLRRCHLTILEVGGAFAHKFEKLVAFLEIPTLVITDIDSTAPRTPGKTKAEDDENVENADEIPSTQQPGKSCITTFEGAITSNETLRQWLPKVTVVSELLDLPDSAKVPDDDCVRVAYQTRQLTSWNNVEEPLAGRTLEEAFALQNLEWSQHSDQTDLGLKIRKSEDLDLSAIHEKIFKKVNSKAFDKTRFALELIARSDQAWTSPTYIVDGLLWLHRRLVPKMNLLELPNTTEVGE
ncbi:AAA family ATPase [Glutamicibacter sp. NPDC058337]|uniref:AAA family ATPase n=1 Tax=Glutamicibacter sp. NPDC058337 TaxID=3346452 RepID=UPI0036544434